ncbi:MAG: TetR/AcrR family transcriptional regulator [Campylobacterota bacterium]|nr:TetR/AcrR family transcriptional regulator [Campylobacterota bacterium]
MSSLSKKLEKRRQIAKSTCDLFIEEGFVNISISQLAVKAGIGKGTIYEYFKNKEDVVFELMSCLQDEYDPKLLENLENAKDSKEKIIYLFDIFLNDKEIVKKQKAIYKEFLAISLNNPTKEILTYQKNLKDKYIKMIITIFQEETNMSEEYISNLASSLYATMNGFFITNEEKIVMLEYINNIFEILKIKGEKI